MKDWIERALKTFAQAFMASFVINIGMIMSHVFTWDFSDAKTWLLPIVTGAVSAGFSAVWNLILEHWKKKQIEDK